MTAPAVPENMKPDKNRPIFGYITKCPVCKESGALVINLLKRVSTRGKRYAVCTACKFDGELFSHKVRHERLWKPIP
jgi:hypothetical protein